MLIDLDARRQHEAKRPEQIRLKDDQTTRVNKNLPFPLKEKVVVFLRKNVDLLAWIAANMLRIDPEFMSHSLTTFVDIQHVA